MLLGRSKSWDKFYLDVANAIASKSHCYSRNVGAIIVRDGVVVSQGFNGPVRKVHHCNVVGEQRCPRREMGFASGEGLEWCPAAHAETNAIFAAARLGVEVKDTIMYLNCAMPCLECSKAIVQSGISEVVVTDMQEYSRGLKSLPMLTEAGVKVRMYVLD